MLCAEDIRLATGSGAVAASAVPRSGATLSSSKVQFGTQHSAFPPPLAIAVLARLFRRPRLLGHACLASPVGLGDLFRPIRAPAGQSADVLPGQDGEEDSPPEP